MFPHTITVFNVDDSTDTLVINKCTVTDVFFYKEKIISQENKGEKYSNTYNCIFSDIALKKYLSLEAYTLLEDKTDKFTLVENKTIITKGDITIESLKDLEKLEDWFYIKTKSDHLDYGDESLRNIEVTN